MRLMSDNLSNCVLDQLKDYAEYARADLAPGIQDEVHAVLGEFMSVKESGEIIDWMTRYAELEVKTKELSAKVISLRIGLNDAAHSLQTIFKLAGRDKHMHDMNAVREYARDRSSVAFRQANASMQSECPHCGAKTTPDHD